MATAIQAIDTGKNNVGYSKHEAVGGFWILTDLTTDAGWESLVCESSQCGRRPNFGADRLDLSMRYATEAEAVVGHAKIADALRTDPPSLTGGNSDTIHPSWFRPWLWK